MIRRGFSLSLSPSIQNSFSKNGFLFFFFLPLFFFLFIFFLQFPKQTISQLFSLFFFFSLFFSPFFSPPSLFFLHATKIFFPINQKYCDYCTCRSWKKFVFHISLSSPFLSFSSLILKMISHDKLLHILFSF